MNRVVAADMSERKRGVHRIVVMVVCAACLALAPVVHAAEHKDRSTLPITVRSNELATNNRDKVAVFTGKVVAKQGDITIFSDRLTVYYGDNQEDIEKIEADGNVRIVQTNRIGLAAHAVYESKEGRITLTGNNPRVSQGADTVTGKIITYYVDEEKSTASGGGDSRVEAVIHPKGKKTGPRGKAAPDEH
jgi:lipopolysaccharide export system protein LptA